MLAPAGSSIFSKTIHSNLSVGSAPSFLATNYLELVWNTSCSGDGVNISKVAVLTFYRPHFLLKNSTATAMVLRDACQQSKRSSAGRIVANVVRLQVNLLTVKKKNVRRNLEEQL